MLGIRGDRPLLSLHTKHSFPYQGGFPPLLRERCSPHPFGAITTCWSVISSLSRPSCTIPLLPPSRRSTIVNPLPTLAPTGPSTDAAAIAEAEKRATKKEE